MTSKSEHPHFFDARGLALEQQVENCVNVFLESDLGLAEGVHVHEDRSLAPTLRDILVLALLRAR